LAAICDQEALEKESCICSFRVLGMDRKAVKANNDALECDKTALACDAWATDIEARAMRGEETICTESLCSKDIVNVVHERKCVFCEVKKNTTTKLLKCSLCNLVRYCSAKCQTAHWNVHKFVCNNVRVLREVAAFHRNVAAVNREMAQLLVTHSKIYTTFHSSIAHEENSYEFINEYSDVTDSGVSFQIEQGYRVTMKGEAKNGWVIIKTSTNLTCRVPFVYLTQTKTSRQFHADINKKVAETQKWENDLSRKLAETFKKGAEAYRTNEVILILSLKTETKNLRFMERTFFTLKQMWIDASIERLVKRDEPTTMVKKQSKLQSNAPPKPAKPPNSIKGTSGSLIRNDAAINRWKKDIKAWTEKWAPLPQ